MTTTSASLDHIELSEMLSLIQNVSSGEDILTALLATVFNVNEKVFKAFLIEVGCPLKFKRYELATGIHFPPQGTYIGDKLKGVSFRPDIWIWEKGVQDSSDADTSNIFIESKLGSAERVGQDVCYQKVRDSWGKEHTFCILIRSTSEPNQRYDRTLNWYHVIDFIRQVVSNSNEPEALKVSQLVKVMQNRLAPEYTEDKDGSDVEAVKENLRRMIQVTKSRFSLHETISKTIRNWEFRGERTRFSRWLPVGKAADGKRYLSLHFALTDRGYEWRAEWWDADAPDEDYAKNFPPEEFTLIPLRNRSYEVEWEASMRKLKLIISKAGIGRE